MISPDREGYDRTMVECSRCGTGYTLATMNGEECGDTQCDGLLYPTRDGANRLWQIKVLSGELCDLGDVPVPDDVALNAIIDKLEMRAALEAALPHLKGTDG